MKLLIDGSWRDVIKIYKDLEVDEITLDLIGDSVSIAATNRSHTATLEAEFTSQDGSKVTPHGSEKVCLDTDEFYRALKSYGKNETVRMEIHNDRVEFNPTEGGHEISIPRMEPGEEEVPDPDLDLSVELEKVNLYNHLSNIKKIFRIEDFHPWLRTNGGRSLEISYEGDSTSKSYSATLGQVSNEMETRYGSELLGVLKGEWNLFLGDKMPLEAQRNFEAGSVWTADVIFRLAPVLEKEAE